MQASFEEALALVLRLEGGFVNDPADPGGATNLGVTRATLAAWRGTAVEASDVRALTASDVRPIYRDRYWKAVRADELPAGLDCAVFDLAVNAGPRRAVLLLQRAAGVAEDGVIGPLTLAACRACDGASLVRSLGALRLAFYRGLPGWPRFGRGWERRVAQVEAMALALAAASGPVPGKVSTPARTSGPAKTAVPAIPPSPRDQERRMTDVKSILASRTVWSNMVGLAALGLSLTGFDAGALNSPAFVDAGLQVVAGGSFIASTVFRIVASRRLVG